MLFLLPLSHFFFKMFVREKEHAADDMAVTLTRDPLSLAGAILSLSRIRARMDPSPVYSTFFPDRATAQSRIKRLVGKNTIQPKREAGRLVISFFLSILIMAMLTGVAFAMPVSKPATTSCQTSQAHVSKNVCCTR
jgi:beta-lactamase regulating signal transducer with metallopeptidase domain